MTECSRAGGVAAARIRSLPSSVLVTIPGHRKQAAIPCSAYQRQRLRIEQRGARCTTGGSTETARSPREQRSLA
jgi:hypothetical protein